MSLNNKVYDFLKPFALIYLPALATLYGAVAVIWGIPGTDHALETFAAVNSVIGGALQLSAKNYAHGSLVVDGTNLKSVRIPMTPEEIASRNSITLKVQAASNPSVSTQPSEVLATDEPVPAVLSRLPGSIDPSLRKAR